MNPGCTQQAATYCCKWEETCDASRIVTGPLWKSPHTCFASHMTQNTIRTHSFHVMYCVSCCHLLHAKPETTHVVSTLDCVCKLCHVSKVLHIKQSFLGRVVRPDRRSPNNTNNRMHHSMYIVCCDTNAAGLSCCSCSLYA